MPDPRREPRITAWIYATGTDVEITAARIRTITGKTHDVINIGSDLAAYLDRPQSIALWEALSVLIQEPE